MNSTPSNSGKQRFAGQIPIQIPQLNAKNIKQGQYFLFLRLLENDAENETQFLLSRENLLICLFESLQVIVLHTIYM